MKDIFSWVLPTAFWLAVAWFVPVLAIIIVPVLTVIWIALIVASLFLMAHRLLQALEAATFSLRRVLRL